MPLYFRIPFSSIDVLIVFGLTAAAIIAAAYHFSSHRHGDAPHRQQGAHLQARRVSVWTEWVLGLVVATVFLGAAIGYMVQA